MRWNGQELETAPIHLEASGCPLCGAPAEGALVTEEPVHTTCIVCLGEIATLLLRQREVRPS